MYRAFVELLGSGEIFIYSFFTVMCVLYGRCYLVWCGALSTKWLFKGCSYNFGAQVFSINHFSWNLRSIPILVAYSNLAQCLCPLCSTYYIWQPSFGVFVLYTLHPWPDVINNKGCKFTDYGRKLSYKMTKEIFYVKIHRYLYRYKFKW
jgi:hypothetical protein